MTASWVPFAQVWLTLGTLGGLGLVWWVYVHMARQIRAPVPTVGLWVMGRRP